MKPKRLTLFAGHYGSGKTNIAVNYAMALKRQGHNVTIADLDIVNPYFRTKDSERELNDAGINLVCSVYANTNLDTPALPKEVYPAIADRDTYLVMDIGGDDRGALALGRFTPAILEEDNYEMVFVANFYRPLTKNAEEALEVMREIEQAGGIKFTCIVNNSNLGVQTTKECVESTFGEAQRLSDLSGLPVAAVTADESIAQKIDFENVISLKLQKHIV